MTNREGGYFPGNRGILEEIGRRLVRRRIERNLTQAELAKKAAVGKRTLERLEAGESTQLSTFLNILRELGLLEDFMGAVPKDEPGPMELLRREGKKPRQRVRHPKKKERGGIVAEGGAGGWTWGDEEP